MRVFQTDGVNHLYYLALRDALGADLPFCESRGGAVRDLGPAFFEIRGNFDQFIFLNERRFNPFFAIVEAAWVLSGSNALAPLNYALKGFDQYSDDKVVLNGAYGHRLRHAFGVDQIARAVGELKARPNSRRAVLTMYGPPDLQSESRDVPCNISVLLKIRDGGLDLTVINRSNDLYFGVPYNLFVFAVLQRYLARQIGCGPGVQRHFTDSLHLYRKDFEAAERVVSGNHCEAIQSVERDIDRFDISCLLDDYLAVSELRFEAIRGERLRAFLESYARYKAGQGVSELHCAADSFGFSVFQWASRNGLGLPNAEMLSYCNRLRG